MTPTESRLTWSMAAAAAMAALGSAGYVSYRSHEAERDHPPVGRFIEVDGVRLHYREAGVGPPLVLLHGNLLSGLDFMLSGLAGWASRRHRVIVFDRPGFGYSDRPRGGHAWGPMAQAHLLRHALDGIGAERPVVLGHSWGALVALAMGLEFPRALRGLVLLSGYYYPTGRGDVLLAAPVAVPVLGDLLRYTLSPLVTRATWSRVTGSMFAPAPVPASFRRYPAWIAARPSQVRATAAEAAMMVPAAARLKHRYGELELPVAIVAGSEDGIVDFRRHAVRLADELGPLASLHVARGSGHMVHYTSPGAVMDAIEDVMAAGRSGVLPRVGDVARAPDPSGLDQRAR